MPITSFPKIGILRSGSLEISVRQVFDPRSKHGTLDRGVDEYHRVADSFAMERRRTLREFHEKRLTTLHSTAKWPGLKKTC